MKKIQVEMPPGYDDRELQKAVAGKNGGKPAEFRIVRKSLDARKKGRIRWILTLELFDKKSPEQDLTAALPIPRTFSLPPSVVVGSGPAGIFAALVLQRAGSAVTLVERGAAIERRRGILKSLEEEGLFTPETNYAFGEGGAGAFSDGKLTSRSKGLGIERDYIHGSYIKAGAPPEIAYLAHPHVGSDILYTVTRSLRREFLDLGGQILFDTRFFRPVRNGGRITGAELSCGVLDCGILIVATGHSAMETTRELIRFGVPFRPKRLAVGFRAEHPQLLINRAQWGVDSLPGVKAAEYRLTAPGQVYSFCMCPGGRVIPASPYKEVNIVNGMSRYARDGRFANAAVVAQFHPHEFLGEEAGPLEVLEWLEELERSAYGAAENSYRAPAISIRAYLEGKSSSPLPEFTSYRQGLLEQSPGLLIPSTLAERIRKALTLFSRRLRGYDQGILLGLESKTSSPVQALREDDRSSPGFPGLYIAGELSGWSGGIISSGADGIRAAMAAIFAASPH